MATGNIRPRRSYAKSQAPTTVTATTSAITTDMVVNWTQSTTGKRAETYVITGSSTNGGITTTVTAGLTATSVTVPLTSANSEKAFTFEVLGVNENGRGAARTSVVYQIPEAYTLNTTLNSSDVFTIPAGQTKMLVVATAGGGRGGESTNQGGAGGGGGAMGIFWEEAVTESTTYTITVGARSNNAGGTAGNTSIVSPNSVTLMSLNGGISGNGGTAGTGGTGTSNASSYIIATGGTGGTGGASPQTGFNPDPATSNNPSYIGYLGPTQFTTGGGGGGGRGSSWYQHGSASGAGGGTGAGSGGNGGGTHPQSQGWFGSRGQAGNSGNAATSPGAGGGGGGGGGFSFPYGQNGGNGSAGDGSAGQVIIYTAS